jgi:hypothetical protein
MMESDDISVQNALQCLGIDSVGSVIFPFGQKPIPPITHPVVVDAIRNECQQIDTLARMLRVQSEGSYSGIYAGFIELLYCVRNLIVHGELSPIDPENEDLIEAAYKILDKLLFEVGKV